MTGEWEEPSAALGNLHEPFLIEVFLRRANRARVPSTDGVDTDTTVRSVLAYAPHHRASWDRRLDADGDGLGSDI